MNQKLVAVGICQDNKHTIEYNKTEMDYNVSIDV